MILPKPKCNDKIIISKIGESIFLALLQTAFDISLKDAQDIFKEVSIVIDIQNYEKEVGLR